MIKKALALLVPRLLFISSFALSYARLFAIVYEIAYG
jgi:hypothetical protein